MKLAVVCLGWAALSGSVAYGQSAKAPAGFEVADIHVSPMVRNSYMRGPFRGGSRYEIRQATMVDLIATAFGVEREKVMDGPNWLEMDRFDIIAKAPAGAKKDEMKGLLQGLLVARFGLAIHKDTRPMRAFLLTTGKKPWLKKSAATGPGGCQISFSMPPPAAAGSEERRDAPSMQYACRNVTMAMFAQELRSSAAAQVIDRTGLEGAWDFELKTPLQGLIIPGAESTAVADALDKQLGLKLTAATLPMEVMAVASVNRQPTDNSVEALAFVKATAPPAEFEVAEIKLSAPAGGRRGMRVQPGGRIAIAGMTLRNMILQAWNVTPEMLVGAPKWIDDDRYDVVAKAPLAAENEAASDAGTADGGDGPDIDTDTVWTMMRALLAERFKLRVHEEVQAMPAYTLLAVKPKMKKADPASRTRFSEGPGADGKDPRNANPINGRLVTAQNVTMAQFAARLQSMAGGYISAPVLDSTGLEGAYDFTLNFSPAGTAGMGLAGGRGGRGGGDAANSSDAPSVADPTGAISLPEAIEKQLGLKLELQKRPIKVLVIDRVERTPTDN